MTRSNLTLVVLLVLLGLLDLATWPRVVTRAGGGPLFGALDPGRVAALELRDPDGDAAGAPLRVERAGDGWRVPSAEGFPADAWLVDELLASLTRLSRADLVSEDPERPADFGLAAGAADAGRGGVQGLDVRVLDPSGAVLAAYRQGEALGRAGAIEGIYLRPAGGSAVYRAPFVPRLSANTEVWLDTRVARFEPGDVRGLELEFAGRRTTSFARDAEGAWSAAAGDAPVVALDRLLAAVGGLYHSGVEAAAPASEHGLEPPLLAVALELEPAEGPPRRVRLAIGGEAGDVTFASFDGWERPWVVRVRTALLADLLDAVEALLERATLVDLPESDR